MSLNSETLSSTEHQSITDQADYWVARLSADNVSADERMQFALWLQQSEQHQAAYEEAMILLQEMEQACEAYYSEAVALPLEDESAAQSLEQDIEQLLIESGQYHRSLEDKGRQDKGQEDVADPTAAIIVHREASDGVPQQPFYSSLSAYYVAACSVLLVIGFFFLPSWNHLTADYSTGFAETQLIELEDGSRVTLNSNSALSVDFSSEVRRVRLLSGEAFFQVRSNADRPYVVQTNNGQTRVLGTAFNVNTHDQSTRVDVFEGVVEVESGSGQQQTLTQGQYRRFDRDFKPDDWDASLQQRRIQDWQQGILVVKNQPLEQVLTQLNRNFSGHLWVLDEQLLQQRVNGVFSLRDRASALQVLTLGLNLQSQQFAGFTLLYQ